MKYSVLNKKNLLVVLMMILLLGFSYGAYSYYSTTGSISGEDAIDDIYLFYPSFSELDEDDNLIELVGNEAKISLYCGDSETGSGTVYCSASLIVENKGLTDILVDVSDSSASSYYETYLTLNPGSVNYSWTSKVISPNEFETLDISIPVDVASDYASDDGFELYAPFDRGAFGNVVLSFKVKATQVHN